MQSKYVTGFLHGTGKVCEDVRNGETDSVDITVLQSQLRTQPQVVEWVNLL